MDLFKRANKIRGLAGDTFPEWKVTVTGMNISNCTMRVELENEYKPGLIAFAKECIASKGTYTVRLTSADTSALSGIYRVHFILTDSEGNEYRKLVGALEVLDTPEAISWT